MIFFGNRWGEKTPKTQQCEPLYSYCKTHINLEPLINYLITDILLQKLSQPIVLVFVAHHMCCLLAPPSIVQIWRRWQNNMSRTYIYVQYQAWCTVYHSSQQYGPYSTVLDLIRIREMYAKILTSPPQK